MSRVAAPSEKVMATVGIYAALSTELGFDDPSETMVIALLNASVTIAMATDTKDMGIMVPSREMPCPARLMHPDAPPDFCILKQGHPGGHVWPDEG